MSATTTVVTQSHAASNTPRAPKQLNINQRLDLYHSLFGNGASKTCQQSGLYLTPSFNYSLQTFLYKSDSHWVLSIIDINNFDNLKKKYGQQLSKRKIVQIGKVIQKFCQNDPRKLKGFKCNDLVINDDEDIYNDAENEEEEGDDDDEYQYESKHDLFALLIYSHPKLTKSERYVSKLMKKIKQQTNESVNVGIAKMNEWETFKQWKQRAIKNLKIAKNKSQMLTETNEPKETEINGEFYSDVDVNYVNPKVDISVDEKRDEQKQEEGGAGVVKKFGTQKNFDAKMQEIANNENQDWVVAVMTIDDFNSFVFSKNNDKQAIKLEIDKLEKEIYHLFDIYGNEINKDTNEIKYYAYDINHCGQYGVILYDSKDMNKCFIPAHEILETLKEEVAIKFEFTVSIGCSRLIEDDLGMTDDWYERVYKNFNHATENGGNQVCFGINHDVKDSKEADEILVDAQSDAIQTKSLKNIQVCWLSCYETCLRVLYTMRFVCVV